MEDTPLPNFQIRLRDPDYAHAIRALARFCDFGAKWLLFRHNKTDNIHYHLYLFEYNTTAKTIRAHLALTHTKECYMVGNTAGKSKKRITPMLAYQYAMAPKSKPELIAQKGFTDDNMKAFDLNAKEYYAAISQPLTAVQVTHEDHYVVRPDRVWERLKSQYERYEGKTIREIKSQLAAEWLNAGKAIMRNADAHRYATSLYYINKFDKEEVPDTALLEQYD